jgi:nucleotide-binding universal stress UspA family protein
MARPADTLPPLLVPLDGSEEAERAVDVAVGLSLTTSLTLVSTGWSGDPDADRAALVAVAERVASAPGAGPEVVLEPDRPAAEVIVAEAERRGAAVCMATRGRGGLRRALFGSVAEDVVRTASGPVLLAGPALTEPAGSGPIVVCFDGSDVSTSILPDVLRWAGALDRAVRVAFVDPEPGRIGTGMMGRPVPTPSGPPYAAELDAVAGRCRSAGIDTLVEHLQAHDAGPAIAAYAAGIRASMVALATHGRSGLRRTTMGSVATDVVRSASCPVLVRRPHGTGGS